MKLGRFLVLGVLVVAPAACGGGSDNADGSISGDGGNALGHLLPDLPPSTASVAGGSAQGASGSGTDSGAMKLTSKGGLSIGPTAAAPATAATIATPAGGTALSADDLKADVSRGESLRIDGKLTSGGTEAMRSITSTAGDVVVAGTLRGANLGGATQGFTLNAPAGTVYVSGVVDTGGADATGGGTAGAAAGAITITAKAIVVSGSLISSGGDARVDGAATGGPAGAVTLTSPGDVTVADVRLHGGGAKSAQADATGGAGATLTIDADGAVHLTGLVDARGGPALASGTATAGTAGSLLVGQTSPPSQIEMGVSIALLGGDGPDVGGAGGELTFQAQNGGVVWGGTTDVSGGSGLVTAGKAGSIHGLAGPSGGGYRVSGKIVGSGGSAITGGNANGGVGAFVRLKVSSQTGPFFIDGGAEMRFDGGDSAGTGIAGAGGDIEIDAVDGDFSLYGSIHAHGGTAPDPGGTGGGGGILYVWTDTNHDGIGGNLIVYPTGLIDVSAGSGTIGGNGRNNGGIGVALFPVHMDQLSVLLNSETIGGNPKDGVLDNQGKIISRGGAANGNGGDCMFHGKQPDGTDKTVPGNIDNVADGTGMNGGFAGE